MLLCFFVIIKNYGIMAGIKGRGGRKILACSLNRKKNDNGAKWVYNGTNVNFYIHFLGGARMTDLKQTCKIAVVQAAPIMFDRAACTAKAVDLIAQAAEQGAELIVFPELFVPGYPYGMTFGFTVGSRNEEGRKDWKVYYDQSIVVPGEETRLMGEAAKKAKAYVSIGVSERDAVNGTLYNTNLFFSPEGELITVHRKLKPTGAERVVWGDADKDYFPVAQTPWGVMGSLICWESYMPLARVALYQKGVSLYISPNTNDNPEWQSTIQHIALEGRCYLTSQSK